MRAEDEMLWDEFINLLSGLNGDTPLGYLVRIRSEKDSKVRKKFTRQEQKIYNEWRSRHSRKITHSQSDAEEALRRVFGIS